jgi:flagellar biosynthetic protein FlhB
MSDRTEAPTPRRRQDAREEGRVARSMELNAAAALLVGGLLLRGPGKGLVNIFEDQILTSISALPTVNITDAWLRQMAFTTLTGVLPGLGLVVLGLMVTGVAISVGQSGLIWVAKRKNFDLGRINPLEGLKRMFSVRGLVELLKALLKLGVVGYAAYGFLRSHATDLIQLSQLDVPGAASLLAGMAMALTLRVGAVYAILAVADYAYQRWDLMRNLRMTKQEIKEEIKRSEGDPFYKGRIRQQQRRIARMRMMANVPKATVVVTNPTHLAVAIQYSPEMNAPKVVAKGADVLAKKIISIARAHNVPVVQNIPVARAIFKTIEVDQEISPELYVAMAEILAYVFRIRRPAATVEPAGS